MAAGDHSATLECLALMRILMPQPVAPLCPPPVTTKYSLVQLECPSQSGDTREAHKGLHGQEWEVCGLPATESALPQLMSPITVKTKPLGVSITQTMVSLVSHSGADRRPEVVCKQGSAPLAISSAAQLIRN